MFRARGLRGLIWDQGQKAYSVPKDSKIYAIFFVGQPKSFLNQI